MRYLPEPIGDIVRTKPFKPSAMSIAESCLLAAVLPSCDPAPPKLKAGPIMTFGSAYHKLYEDLAKGRLVIESGEPDAFGESFDRIIQGLEAPRKGYLREALGETRYERMRLSVLRKSAAMHSEFGYVQKFGGENSHSKNENIRSGSERVISSKLLEIEGRYDRIQVAGNDVTVIDYKWSAIRDKPEESTVNDFIQLELYGLAIREQSPAAKISLRIEGTDGSNERYFSESEINARLEWLQEIRTKVPNGVSIKAENIASPGYHFNRCGHRNVCAKYLDAAPIAWS
jgi:hypothetical protein